VRRALIVFCLGSVTTLGACSGSVSLGSNVIAKADLQNDIATQLAAQVHQPAPTIACPGDLDAKVGTTTDCILSTSDSTAEYNVHVVVQSVSNGTAHFDIQVGTSPLPATSTTTVGGSTTTDDTGSSTTG
jgi:hypothetical protein